MALFPKKQLKANPKSIPDHCALGWGRLPQVGYSDGTIIYSKKADMVVNREFYLHDPENLNAWPIDPKTGERLPIKRS
jgi:hypothetical protein